MNSAYLLLFLSALGAATLLPLQSEALLSALIVAGEENIIALLVVASLGNVLGSLINWWLGLHLEKYRDSRFFPLKPEQLVRAQVRYQKAGYWSLLLSWVPIIGDPLTLIAGVMKEPLWRFLVLVSIAKSGRYIALALLVVQL